MGHTLPDRCLGWSAEGPVREYDPGTIFGYIDGAGEIYVTSGMRRLTSRRYVADGRPPIVADLFDMGAAENAFSVFTLDRDGDDAGVGRDSDYAAGLLRFWKGRHFASVLAERETPETREAAIEIGRCIAAAAPDEGGPPALLDLMPPEGLDRDGLRYVVSAQLLEQMIAPLGATQGTPTASGGRTGRVRAVLGAYVFAEGRARLLIVEETGPAEARAAAARIVSSHARDARPGEPARTPAGHWTAGTHSGRYAVVILDAPTAGIATDLLEAAVGHAGSVGR